MDKDEIQKFHEKIKIFDDKENGIIAFADGPISIDSYCQSNFPIIFVLQEPYTDSEQYNKYLSEELPRPNTAEDKQCYSSMLDFWEKEEYGSGYKTYLSLVSIVNQIFEGNCSYKVCKDESAYEKFKNNVAILNVNVKKVPHLKVASSGDYKEWAKYEKNIEYMCSQIKVLKPKVVIMANIAKHLMSEKDSGCNCSIWDDEILAANNIVIQSNNRVYLADNTLYIDTGHFSRLSNVRKQEIIEISISWKNGEKILEKFNKA